MLPLHKSNASVDMDAGRFCRVECDTGVESAFLEAL